MKDIIKTIGITKETKKKIRKVGKKFRYADVTVLEYLLNGKINLKELNKINSKEL